MNDELPPSTSDKAWAAGIGGVVVTMTTILALVPEGVKANMDFYQWGSAIVGAFILCFGGTWVIRNRRK